jgi:uncharacterized protein YydD (DUF2326 family)
MLYALTSNRPLFKPVEFRKGLNIIMAERQSTTDEELPLTQRRTRNGAGKSSIIDLVHFLLAGKPEGALTSKALIDWSFRLTLDVGPEIVEVQREIGNARMVYVEKAEHPRYAKKISAAEWATRLGKTWFRLEGGRQTGGVSFRQLITYFARRRRDGGYDSPVRTFRAQTNAVIETRAC